MLSTKQVKVGSGGSNESKTLDPGNHQLYLTDVTLKEATFKPGHYDMILNVHGPKIEGFEGFLVDKDKPELGHLPYKVGKVRGTEWPMGDSETKTGVKIFRDLEILKQIKLLCIATGSEKWFDEQDEKHDTIEQFVEAFNNDKPFMDKMFYGCLAGKEYTNKAGYAQFDLYFPKYTKAGAAYSNVEKNVVRFDEDTHIKRKKTTTVDEFSSGSDDFFGNLKDEFSLD